MKSGKIQIGREKVLRQYLLGVLLHLDLPGCENLFHDSVLIGDESGAEDAHRHLAIHLFLSIHPQLVDESFLRVGDEGEGEVVLGDELFVRLRTLRAHPHTA